MTQVHDLDRPVRPVTVAHLQPQGLKVPPDVVPFSPLFTFTGPRVGPSTCWVPYFGIPNGTTTLNVPSERIIYTESGETTAVVGVPDLRLCPSFGGLVYGPLFRPTCPPV